MAVGITEDLTFNRGRGDELASSGGAAEAGFEDARAETAAARGGAPAMGLGARG
jgi:hypothetical protein